ncbi:YitT family protein [Pullulanibacillus sp. KACC 23026]|uniref:YitT family protein n=1 Tax=Pullulanibacillus sp. KACC 23026 TaxID=3028315 RepID=UPI0023AF1A9E|nr:YitT family protein [Pullulanibacillus sp. KACC 23026]WEG13519.1 YitT family protein [Pullulanibacillus sp. KACC 23026]
MKVHKKLDRKHLLRKAITIPIGALLSAIGLEIFLVPNHILDGGITGISIILAYVTHFPLGVFIGVLNLPFIIIGYKQIGKTFAFSTLYAIICLSIFTSIFIPIPQITTDPLLASVFGGVILGIGVGIVIRNGGSQDGTEILSILLNKKTPFSVGEIVMFVNVFILGSAGFVFDWNSTMYSLLAYFIAFKTIDITIEGLEQSKAVWIISDVHEEIGDALNNRLGRGVTYLNGQGAYSHDKKQVIFTIVTRLEEAKLKSIVEDIDPNAFLAVGDIHDVKGGNFKKRDIH